MGAAATAPLSTRLSVEEKKLFDETCESLGISPSNAVRMFVVAFNKRGGFPFDPSNPYGFNRETLAAMEEAATGENLSGPFDSVAELMASLEQDEG